MTGRYQCPTSLCFHQATPRRSPFAFANLSVHCASPQGGTSRRNKQGVSTGDAFANNLNCDYAQGGIILSWAKVLDEVLELDFDMVIPGHGNDPLRKADIRATRQRLAKIAATAIDLVQAAAR